MTDEQVTDARPWHGQDNPLEALYQHFHQRMLALEAKFHTEPPDPAVQEHPSAEEIRAKQAADAEANERARIASEALRHPPEGEAVP